MLKDVPVERVAFVTITWGGKVSDHGEAMRRWKNLTRRDAAFFLRWFRVSERFKSGHWHLHALVVLPWDIRTGTDLERYRKAERIDWQACNPQLRELLKKFIPIAKRHALGRFKIEPVGHLGKTCTYLAKSYLLKDFERVRGSKRVRRWSMSANCPRVVGAVGTFTMLTRGSFSWRHKTAAFAAWLGCRDLDEVSELLGKAWAKKYGAAIRSVTSTACPLPNYFESWSIEDFIQEHEYHLLRAKRRRWRKSHGMNWDEVPTIFRHGYPVGIYAMRYKQGYEIAWG